MRSRLCRTFAIFSFDLYFAYIFFYSASILFYFARCRLAHRERESERECIYVHCVCALCWFAHWLGVRNGVFDRNVIFTHTPQATSSAVFSVAHLFRTMAKECNTSRHTNTHNTRIHLQMLSYRLIVFVCLSLATHAIFQLKMYTTNERRAFRVTWTPTNQSTQQSIQKKKQRRSFKILPLTSIEKFLLFTSHQQPPFY